MNQQSKRRLIVSSSVIIAVIGAVLAFGCNNVIVPNIPSGWTAYTDPHSGLQLNYPSAWTPNTEGSYTYFTLNDVDVLDLKEMVTSSTLEQAAQAVIADNSCAGVDANGQPVDHIISKASSGVLFVLSCSASTDNYDYMAYSSNGSIVEVDFHDA